MVTVNGTLNPVSFIRKYYIDENLTELEDILKKLANAALALDYTVNQTLAENKSTECLMELEENLRKFRNNSMVSQIDEVVKELRRIVEENEYLGMYDGFAL
jgi:DNA-binding ferritin-like protein